MHFLSLSHLLTPSRVDGKWAGAAPETLGEPTREDGEELLHELRRTAGRLSAIPSGIRMTSDEKAENHMPALARLPCSSNFRIPGNGKSFASSYFRTSEADAGRTGSGRLGDCSNGTGKAGPAL